MKKLFFILMLIWPGLLLAQHKKESKLRVIHLETAQKYGRCVHRHLYSDQQRLQLYPFNVADTIKLISYESSQPNYNILPVLNPMDTVEIFVPIRLNEFWLNKHRVIENIALTQTDINTLTDIFFNVGFASKRAYNYPIPSFTCYNPRNAILFIKEGKIIQYIDCALVVSVIIRVQKRLKLEIFATKNLICSKAFSILRG